MVKEMGTWVKGGHTVISCKAAKQQPALAHFRKVYELTLAMFWSMRLRKLQENW